MEDSDILPYMQTDKFPTISTVSRAQQTKNFFAQSRSGRLALWAGKPAWGLTKRQYKIHPRRTIAIILALLALTSGTVYALTSQSFPASPTVTPGAAVTVAGCGTLAYPATMPTGAIGSAQEVLVNCNSTTAGFTVTTLGTDTPTFTLPSTGVTVTSLAIVASTGSCGSAETTLASATQVSLSSSAYNFCVHYTVPSSAASIATFSISWAT